MLETESDGGGGRFVDNVEDVEAGHIAGVLGGFATSFIEVGGDSDDDLLEIADLFAGVHPEFI